MDNQAGMTVSITGATGFVGRHVAATLLGRGHRIRALVRDRAKAAAVLPNDPRVELVDGDISDEAAVTRLLHGADACVHLVGIIREAPNGQTFERMHVAATRTVVRGCEDQGVTRYLHMSALGAGPEGPAAYQKTKYEAEQIVRGSGLDWTIFRPGLIVGKDGEFFGQLRAWCEGRSAPYLFLPYFLRVELDGLPSPTNLPKIVAPTVAPVDVDDVAGAFAEALQRPESIGEVFPLCGAEKLTWPQMLRLTRDTLPQGKRELKAIGLPGWVMAMKVKAARAVGLAGLFPFDEGMAMMGERDSWAPLDKAEAVLGFAPRGFGQSLQAIVSG